ncbi:MAG TPA: hypothetical protein VF281_02145 [Candidatus Saccharimonadales bacterium]
MSIFDEILSCKDCPDTDVIFIETDEGKATMAHLESAHPGVSGDAFVTAKRKNDRDRIQNLYDKAKDYLDVDFSSKFLREFEARTWEMAVYQYLVENGITVNKNVQTEGPDFDTSIGYVECKVVKRGDSHNAVPVMQAATYNEETGTFDDVDAQPVPMNEIKLRFSSAYAEKTRKYEGYYNKDWYDKEKPKLIAINWYCGGTALVANPMNVSTNAVLQVLFATGYPKLVINTKDNSITSSELTRELTLTNAKGASFDVGYFAKPYDSEESRIDGIIHTNSWPGLYYPERFMAVNNAFSNKFDIKQVHIGGRAFCKIEEDGFSVKMEH